MQRKQKESKSTAQQNRAATFMPSEGDIANADDPVIGKQFDGQAIRQALETREIELLERNMNCKSCSIPLVAVTTTMKDGHLDSSQLSQKGITVIIVGDREISQLVDAAIKETRNIIYLSVETQKKLYPKMGDFISSNSIARKNIGYLHAMKLGACMIYDFDEENKILEYGLLEKVRARIELKSELVLDSEQNVVNAYLLYGTPAFVWPRGFPQEYQSNVSFPLLKAADVRPQQIGVVQILQLLYPDVDALWRLRFSRHLPFKWATAEVLKENLVSIHKNRYAPFNSQATLIEGRLLFLNYLPHTLDDSVSDIWRAYIMQYLMKRMNFALAFAAPFVEHRTFPQSPLADLVSEQQLYVQSGALIDYLDTRVSKSNRTELEYIIILNEMYSRGYIGAADVSDAIAWISTLNEMGYCFANFTENEMITRAKQPAANEFPRFDKVMAVLNIDNRWFTNIPIWMSIYSSIYPNVAVYVSGSYYCGEISTLSVRCISPAFKGPYSYDGIANEILQRSLDDFDGFLFMQDDVALNPFAVSVSGPSFCCPTDLLTDATTWGAWTASYGKPESRIFLSKSTAYRNFSFYAGQADAYYIRKADANTFREIAQDMREANLYMEIAVSTIFSNVLRDSKRITLYTNWSPNRSRPDYFVQAFCDGDYDMVHPLKISTLPGILAHLKAKQCSLAKSLKRLIVPQ